jgi:pimeloyl-ACP methyl ester carboxylesterase
MRAGIAVLISIAALAGVAATPSAALAAPREARVPLRDGRLDCGDFSAAVCKELGLPACDVVCGNIKIDGPRGALLLQALNRSLGDGCRLTLDGDALVLHVDPEKLPRDCEKLSRAVRVFASVAAPNATAAQAASYGLTPPERVADGKPMVVLVHGLDCDRANWGGIASCLAGEGYHVAYFTYPSDQPIAESAEFLGEELASFRRAHPGTSVTILAHSMGGLVSRAYVEGENYAGGVERLIMIAPPNAGSHWAWYRTALEVEEHFHLWRHEKDWSPSWMITDGLGEAGRDLRPGSKFLRELNARPRREGVRYTIIAGSQHPARKITAECLDATSRLVPQRAASWWGFRHCKDGLGRGASSVRSKSGGSDGPVKLDSARLEGVDDFVVVQADHASLYLPNGKLPPAAWEVIHQRLAH